MISIQGENDPHTSRTWLQKVSNVSAIDVLFGIFVPLFTALVAARDTFEAKSFVRVANGVFSVFAAVISCVVYLHIRLKEHHLDRLELNRTNKKAQLAELATLCLAYLEHSEREKRFQDRKLVGSVDQMDTGSPAFGVAGAHARTTGRPQPHAVTPEEVLCRH